MIDVLAAVLLVTPGDVIPKLPQLHIAILVGGAYSGVDGAAHVIIVHGCRTFVNVFLNRTEVAALSQL